MSLYTDSLALIRTEESIRQRTWSTSASKTFLSILRDRHIAVDKSLIIKDLIEDDGKVYLITCPRRWGKSLNLDMIKNFFQIQEDNPTDKSYRLFVHGEIGSKSVDKKISRLVIAKHKKIMDQYLGQFPVIHLSLNFCRNIKNFESMVARVESCVRCKFHEFRNIRQVYEKITNNETSDSAKSDAYRKFDKYADRCSDKKLNSAEIVESVVFLSEILFKYYNKKVIILMDEYFNPWSQMFLTNDFPKKDKKKCLRFYTDFLVTTFTANPYIAKGIITGVLPPSEELHRALNATECNLLNGKFMQHYGFSQREMQTIFDILNISDTTRQKVDQWYKGYKANNKDLIIYNMVSITEFLRKDLYFDDYWKQKGSYGYLVDNFNNVGSFRNKLQLLKKGQSITVTLKNQYLTWADYELLINATANKNINVDERFTDKAFMYLHALGYLTLADNANFTSNKYLMKFPNMEVASAFYDNGH